MITAVTKSDNGIRLTRRQRKAIRSRAKVTIVVAGPGTGKTLTLAHRVSRLRKRGAKGKHILAFTFGREAAARMEAQISKLCPGLRLPWLGTSHAICSRILEAEGIVFKLCDEYEQDKILDAILKELPVDREMDVEKARQHIARVKTHALAHSTPVADAKFKWRSSERPVMDRVYEKYEACLHAGEMKDFTDLLRDTIMLLKEKPERLRHYQKQFQHILADELQDFTPLQFELMLMLRGDDNALWCVGDDDQTIYSWLGADCKLMHGLLQHPDCEIIKLNRNFRSFEPIIAASQGLIGYNKERISKVIEATRGTGDKIIVRPAANTNNMAQYIVKKIGGLLREGYEYQDIAILGRRHVCWRHVHKVLEQHGIPCVSKKDKGLLESKDAQMLINYFKLIADKHANDAFISVINYPARSIGIETLSLIRENAKQHHCSYLTATKRMVGEDVARDSLASFYGRYKGWRRLAKRKPPLILAKAIIKDARLNSEAIRPLLDCIATYPNIRAFLRDCKPYSHRCMAWSQTNAVRLNTIHGAKGQEFKIVFLVGWEHGVLPDERGLEGAALEEERRLAYVAITRAADKLFINYVKNNRFTHLRESNPSRFLSEIPANLIRVIGKDERLAVPVEKRNEQNIAEHVSGDTVFHQKYGYGKIVRVALPHAKVRFSHIGSKRVLSNELQKLRTQK